MQPIFATIRKELLVLLRDRGGLAMIFLMPLVLVVVMSVIEDAPFRDYQEVRFEIGLVDEDRDSLAAELAKGISQSRNFSLRVFHDTATALLAIQDGHVKAVIYVPDSATEQLQQTVSAGVQQMFVAFGMMDSADALKGNEPVDIRLILDPVLKKSFRSSIRNQLEKNIARVQQHIMARAFERQLATLSERPLAMSINFSEAVMLTEQYGTDKASSELVLNSVQHNVPAWAMFAMFFILFPLAGNLIKERGDGSIMRVRIITGSYLTLVSGKLILYNLVCVTQFLIILAAGLYLMPFIGLPTLETGSNYLAIAAVIGAVSLAATAYGLMVAVVFQSHHMALMFGAVSVVIMAAIGGVWLPVEIMPAALQQIAAWSPLAWGMHALQSLFLKNGNLHTVAVPLLQLLLFAFACFAVTVLKSKISNRL